MTALSQGDVVELLQLTLDEFVEDGRRTYSSPLVTAYLEVTSEQGNVTTLLPTEDSEWSSKVRRIIRSQDLPPGGFRQIRARDLSDSSEDSDADMFLFVEDANPELTQPFHLRVGMFYDRPPTSRLPPLRLRQLLLRVEYTCASSLPQTLEPIELASLAFNARAVSDGMKIIADCCHAAGAILWSFNFDSQEYRSIATHGPTGHGFIVRLDGLKTPTGARSGIVGQVRPGRPVVVYSVDHPQLRQPSDLPNWTPHDPDVLSKNGWDICVAWPVIADGELLGALSVYGRRYEDLRVTRTVRNLCAGTCAEFVGAITSREELERSEVAYEDEISRNKFGRLATELVHDYKSSLANVENLLLNLDPTTFPEGMRRLYSETKESISYLKQVTASLSKLARGIRVGTTADLKEVLDQNADFLRAVALRENAKVQVNLHYPRQLSRSESTTVKMDDLTAIRVLLNLVQNGAIWTRGVPEPQIDIRLTAGEFDRGTRESMPRPVRLEVADNGPGVYRDIAPKIFGRGESNRKADGGSGLGLYIVKRAVDRAGGKISEIGRKGDGAKFVVLLPSSVDPAFAHLTGKD